MDLLRLHFLNLLQHLFLGDILDCANARPYFFDWLSINNLFVINEKTILRPCDRYVEELKLSAELRKLSLDFSLVFIIASIYTIVVVLLSEKLGIGAISLKLFYCGFRLDFAILFRLGNSNSINQLLL